MVLKSVENPLDFGIVITEEDGRISRFLEAGLGAGLLRHRKHRHLSARALGDRRDPRRGRVRLLQGAFPKLLEAGRPLYGYHRGLLGGYRHPGAVCQRPARRARRPRRGRQASGTRLRENIYVGRRAQVDDDELEGPVVIGENSASTRARGSGPTRSSPTTSSSRAPPWSAASSPGDLHR